MLSPQNWIMKYSPKEEANRERHGISKSEYTMRGNYMSIADSYPKENISETEREIFRITSKNLLKYGNTVLDCWLLTRQSVDQIEAQLSALTGGTVKVEEVTEQNESMYSTNIPKAKPSRKKSASANSWFKVTLQ